MMGGNVTKKLPKNTLPTKHINPQADINFFDKSSPAVDKLQKKETVSGESVKQSTDDNQENSNQTILNAEQISRNMPPLKKTETEPYSVSKVKSSPKDRRFSGSKIPEKQASIIDNNYQLKSSVRDDKDLKEKAEAPNSTMKNSIEILEKQVNLFKKYKTLPKKEDSESTIRSLYNLDRIKSSETINSISGGITNKKSDPNIRIEERPKKIQSMKRHSLSRNTHGSFKKLPDLSPIIGMEKYDFSPKNVSPNFFSPFIPEKSKNNMVTVKKKTQTVKPQHYRLNLLDLKDEIAREPDDIDKILLRDKIKSAKNEKNQDDSQSSSPSSISSKLSSVTSFPSNNQLENRLNRFKNEQAPINIDVNGEQFSKLDFDNYSIITEDRSIQFAEEDEKAEKVKEGESPSSDKLIRGRNGKVSKQLTIFDSLEIISENDCSLEKKKENSNFIKRRKDEPKYTYTTASNISPTHEKLLEKASSLANKEKVFAPLFLFKSNDEYKGRRESIKKQSMKTYDEVLITNLRKRSVKTQTTVPKNVKEFQGDRSKKKINNYIILKSFKSVSNKRVQLAFDRDQNKNYVLKKIPIKDIASSHTRITQDQKLMKLIANLKKIENDNIIKLKQVLEDEEKKKLYFIMEYASTGVILSKEFWRNSLIIYNKKHGGELEPAECETFPKYFEPEVARGFFLQVLKAVVYIHESLGMVVRCLKIKNLLVEKKKLKLLNFGFDFLNGSSSGISESNMNIHNYYYAAPEVINGEEFLPETDIWHCGILLYYFTHGHYPFTGGDINEIKSRIQHSEPVFSNKCQYLLKNLLRAMLDKNPKNRPLVRNLLLHDWIHGKETESMPKSIFEKIDKCSKEEMAKAVERVYRRSRVVLSLKLKKKSSNNTPVFDPGKAVTGSTGNKEFSAPRSKSFDSPRTTPYSHFAVDHIKRSFSRLFFMSSAKYTSTEAKGLVNQKVSQAKRRMFHYMIRTYLFKKKYEDTMRTSVESLESVLSSARHNVNLQQELHNEIKDISSQGERGAKSNNQEEEGFRTLRTIQEENDEDEGEESISRLAFKFKELEKIVEVLKKNEINIINRYKIELKSLAKSFQDFQNQKLIRERSASKENSSSKSASNDPQEKIGTPEEAANRRGTSNQKPNPGQNRQNPLASKEETEYFKRLYEEEKTKLNSLNIKFVKMKENLDEVNTLFLDFQKEKMELVGKIKSDEVERNELNLLRKRNLEMEKDLKNLSLEVKRLKSVGRSSATPEKKKPSAQTEPGSKMAIVEKELEFLKSELMQKEREIENLNSLLKRSHNERLDDQNAKLKDTILRVTPTKNKKSSHSLSEEEYLILESQNRKTQKFTSTSTREDISFPRKNELESGKKYSSESKRSDSISIFTANNIEKEEIMNAIKEKDLEITKMQQELRKLEMEFNKKIEQMKIDHNQTLEKNMSSMVNYLQQKEEELERLRNIKIGKKPPSFEDEGQSSSSERSIGELENLLMLASKDIRKKEKENERLRSLLEERKGKYV